MYRVLSNVTQPDSGYLNITNALQVDLQCDVVPMFQFAIFYNSLLEFTWAAPLTVRGSTHANTNIFVGSSTPLVFTAFVSSSGIMTKTNWGGYTMSQFTGTITFATNVNGGYATNFPILTLPIGTNNTPDAVRQVVDMPPAGESPTSAMGQARYYNMAGMDLLVSNNTVTAIIKNSSTDPSPITLVVTNYGTNSASLSTNLPFLSVTNTFTDQREGKTVLTTQVDMGRLNTWVSTNSSIATKHPTTDPFNILYVADNRTVTGSQLAAVRLTNGVVLPPAPEASGAPSGFTVATPNPLYVWGNYNCTNSAYLNTTNTTATVPAALISDALTVLSPSWKDSASNASFGTGVRVATSTTLNAAILTGVVYTGGSTGDSPFSGGVVNLPRLLEDWGNGGAVTLTLNTSIVNLYNSVVATGPWQTPGVYYYAPTRSFNFNSNFLTQSGLPPGTPMVNYIYRQAWTVPPPNTTNFFTGSLCGVLERIRDTRHREAGLLPSRALARTLTPSRDPFHPPGGPGLAAPSASPCFTQGAWPPAPRTRQPAPRLEPLPLHAEARTDIEAGSMPARRVFVTAGTNRFAFSVPEGFRLVSSGSDSVSLASTDYRSLLTFRIAAPGAPAGEEPPPALWREAVLQQHPGAQHPPAVHPHRRQSHRPSLRCRVGRPRQSAAQPARRLHPRAGRDARVQPGMHHRRV